MLGVLCVLLNVCLRLLHVCVECCVVCSSMMGCAIIYIYINMYDVCVGVVNCVLNVIACV